MNTNAQSTNRERNKQHGSDSIHRNQPREVRLSPLRRRSGTAAGLSAALHRHPGQLGSRGDRSARAGREVILFESAGLGRSTGRSDPGARDGEARAGVPGRAGPHASRSIGLLAWRHGRPGVALSRSSLVRKMLLVGTAPEGGDDIMHLEKPELKTILDDPTP